MEKYSEEDITINFDKLIRASDVEKPIEYQKLSKEDKETIKLALESITKDLLSLLEESGRLQIIEVFTMNIDFDNDKVVRNSVSITKDEILFSLNAYRYKLYEDGKVKEDSLDGINLNYTLALIMYYDNLRTTIKNSIDVEKKSKLLKGFLKYGEINKDSFQQLKDICDDIVNTISAGSKYDRTVSLNYKTGRICETFDFGNDTILIEDHGNIELTGETIKNNNINSSDNVYFKLRLPESVFKYRINLTNSDGQNIGTINLPNKTLKFLTKADIKLVSPLEAKQLVKE